MAGSGKGRQRGTVSAGGFESWSEGKNAARARLADGLVVPRGASAFRLWPQAKVFFIGPWVARGLELALRRSGVQVTSLDREARLVELRRNPELGLLNKQNPLSIRQEIDWASGRKSFPREGLVPLADLHVDPTLCARAPHGGAEALMTRRRLIAAYFARALAADLVVVMASAIETWFDRRTKLAMNGAPLQRVYDSDPRRFTVRRLEIAEIATNLRAICTALSVRRGEGQDGRKLVLAVSPEPLERTYGAEDVIVANLAGKSALHAAAIEVAAQTEGVDYFPAFDAVASSDPARAWMPDRRTLRPEMLEAIAAAFIERYGLMITADSKTAGTA